MAASCSMRAVAAVAALSPPAAGQRQRQQQQQCGASNSSSNAAASCRRNPLRSAPDSRQRQQGPARRSRQGATHSRLDGGGVWVPALLGPRDSSPGLLSTLPSACTAGMRVLALDAAFPFDREAQLKKQHSQQSKCVAGFVAAAAAMHG